jgi:hypothetical protein
MLRWWRVGSDRVAAVEAPGSHHGDEWCDNSPGALGLTAGLGDAGCRQVWVQLLRELFLSACEVIEVIKARGKMIEIAGQIINVSWRAIED